MADEQNTNGEQNTQTDEQNNGKETTVTMTQDKLDELINSRFKKGAEKASTQLLETLGVESIDDLKGLVTSQKERDEAAKTDLEKALDAVEEASKKNEDLGTKYKALVEINNLNELAVKYGIKEVDYFSLEFNQNKDIDGFNIDTFIAGLKESKPMLFGQGAKPPNTDTSGNNGNPTDLKSKLKGMSLNELKKLQNSL